MNLEYNKGMAAIDFPNSPTIGDEFVTASTVYVWTGTFWQVKQSTIAPSSFATANPAMNGVASAGTSPLASRSDHVHPSDTTKASVTHASAHAAAGSDPITRSQSQVTDLVTDLSNKAPLNSPAFTGTVSFSGATVTGIDLLPSQTGNSGKYLTTNGTAASWATVDALPSQTDNSGKYLTTNGTTASWATLDLSLYLTIASASSTYEPIIAAGTTSQYLRGDKTWATLDKSAVGLSNVENTALSTWGGSSNITTLGTVTTVTSPTAAGSSGVRKITVSTSAATGGADGDIWMTYV